MPKQSADSNGRPERMSGIDTTWLRLQKKGETANLAALLVFEQPVVFEQLRDRLAHRLESCRRFRQRVTGWQAIFGHPWWEDDPQFDIGHHMHRLA